MRDYSDIHVEKKSTGGTCKDCQMLSFFKEFYECQDANSGVGLMKEPLNLECSYYINTEPKEAVK